MQVDFIPFGEDGDWQFNLSGLTSWELGLIDVALGRYKAPPGVDSTIESDMLALKSLIKDQSNTQVRALFERIDNVLAAGEAYQWALEQLKKVPVAESVS